MIVTVIKATFKKLKPKIIHYRDYKKISNNHFKNHVINELSMETIKADIKGLQKFLQICSNTLNKFAPKKKNIQEETTCLHELVFNKSSYEKKLT